MEVLVKDNIDDTLYRAREEDEICERRDIRFESVIITQEILDKLNAKAKESPRLRCNLDMRNSAADQSQRMLNALEPGKVMPIHKRSSETCICIRGHSEEYFYGAEGRLADTIGMVPGGVVLNIEKGQWHSLKCLESGTVLFEAKDGAYEPLGPDDFLSL